MNLAEWLENTTTSNKARITAGERERRKMERVQILKKAGTTMGTLRGALFRGSLGIKTARRLEAATKGTSAEFRVADQFPELAPK